MQVPAGAGWVCAVLAFLLAAQGWGSGSLSEIDIEFSEAKVTLERVLAENDLLKKRRELAQDQIRALTESLAVANSEAEVFKREAGELRLKMEALGLNKTSPQQGKLEERLLKAVSDFRIVQLEREKLADQLVLLIEAVVRYSKAAVTTDAESRLALETQVRAANEALGLPGQGVAQAEALPSSLNDGLIVSLRDDLGLIVTNLGRREGAKIGMPFGVFRGEKRVGTVRVIDVREKISGAVVQDLNKNSERLKVGDRLKVDAQQ